MQNEGLGEFSHISMKSLAFFASGGGQPASLFILHQARVTISATVPI
jgi:hypothetical protein